MKNFIRNYANIPNPITNFFNKIEYVELDRDYRKKIEWLESMKKVPLYVKYISIYPNDAEELEILTDPNLHNTPIKILKLTLDESFNISSKTIENLQTICPNSITLSDCSIYSDEYTTQILFGSYTKLLSKLDQTSLKIDFDKYCFNFELEFSDVILKVVESNEECSYIRAKSVEIRCYDGEFCWIK